MAEHEGKGLFGLKPGHFAEPLLSILGGFMIVSMTGVLVASRDFLVRHGVDFDKLPWWLDDDDYMKAIAGGVLALLAFVFFGGARTLRKRRKAKVKVAADRLCIFVAKFEGDEKEAVRDRVIASLREVLGTGVAQVARANLELRLDETVSDVEDEAKGAEKEAQAYLKKYGGHLMIWGRPDSEGETHVVDVRFFSAVHHGEEGRQFGYAPKSLRLEEKFGKEMGTALAAIAAPLAAVAVERAGNYLAEILKPIAKQLEPMVRSLPNTLTPDDRGGLLFSYALAEQTIGEQTGESFRLEAAVQAYGRVLEEWTRERVPLQWATAQNNLGNALRTLGERESGTGRLEQAVAAYKLALEERTRERVPLDWAMTQNNLGTALQTLGARESGTTRLEEAVAAYKLALEERTRERVPLDWATTQNNLGNALATLGERESGTERLEQAVAAYTLALEEWTRERVPLDWAGTQNNLGNALLTLGERESGTGRLEEAVAAYRLALEEMKRERVPLDWAMTQNNLGNALWTLGERESGKERLEEAVAA